MSYIRFAATRLITLCFSVLVCLPATPVSAQVTPVLYSELSSTLQSLKTTLEQYISTPPAGEVKGAETIVVANDLELHAALQRVTGGETIQLKPGNYGLITIQEDQYARLYVGEVKSPKRTGKLTSPVTVTSLDDANRAVVAGIISKGAPHWRFEGLSIRPPAKKTAIEIFSDNNVVARNDITFGDSEDWDEEDWNAITGNGISARNAKNVVISNNYLKNVDFGIGISHDAPNARVIGNIIDTFNGDAMRGLGDDGLFEDNVVKNPLQTDSNHSDGFQSWRDYVNNNRPVEGITIRHNSFINLREHPLSSAMQGIGLFDGPYKDFTIENNLLVLDTWHGINISGAIDSVIRNNLVVDINTERPNVWIRIGNVKASYTGAPSENSRMENNVSTNPMEGAEGVTYANNTKITIADYDRYFNDYRNNDWTVKPGALAFSVGARSVTTVPEPEGGANPVPAPSEPVPTPEVSNTPTPETSTTPTPTTEPAPTPAIDTVSISLATATKVYKTPGGEILGTQKSGGTGKYAKSSMVSRSGYFWVLVDFKTGVDGYINLTLFEDSVAAKKTEKAAEKEDAPGTKKKSITVTDNVNVRATPNGSVLAVQKRGAVGMVQGDVESVVSGGHTWVYVDFADGTDGYVAVSFTQEQFNNRDALLAQIKVLLAQIIALQEKLKERKS